MRPLIIKGSGGGCAYIPGHSPITSNIVECDVRSIADEIWQCVYGVTINHIVWSRNSHAHDGVEWEGEALIQEILIKLPCLLGIAPLHVTKSDWDLDAIIVNRIVAQGLSSKICKSIYGHTLWDVALAGVEEKPKLRSWCWPSWILSRQYLIGGGYRHLYSVHHIAWQ